MIRRALALLIVLLTPSAALAQSCSFNVSSVAFNNVDTLSAAATDVTATVAVSCTGVSLTTIRICPSIGSALGVRQMTGGASTLNYQLYQDAGRSVVWGSYNWALAGLPPTIDLPLALNGTGSTNLTIYARVPAGQGSAPPGNYTASFTTADTDFIYATLGILPCPTIIAFPQHAHPTFAVNASVQANCAVAASDIGFGSQGLLNANIDQTSTISVTCTAGTTYTVGLDDGGQNAGPSGRAMALGNKRVGYGLYRDAARSQVWGSAIASNTVGGAGTGAAQNLTVYARVPPQTTPPAGTYSDVIVVTVTY